MEKDDVGKQTPVVPSQQSSIIFHIEYPPRKDKAKAKNTALCSDLRTLGRISSLVDDNASFANRGEVQKVVTNVSNPDATPCISPASVYRVSNAHMCPASMVGNCSKQDEAKGPILQSLNIKAEKSLDDSSSVEETTSFSSSYVFNTERPGQRKDGSTHSANPVGSSQSVDSSKQALNAAKGSPQMKGHATVAKRKSIADPTAEMKKGPFWNYVVKSVSKTTRSLQDSSSMMEETESDDPSSLETKEPRTTAPLTDSTKMEKNPYEGSFMKMRGVSGETKSFKGNTSHSEKFKPTSASMKLFVITDKQGNQRLVKAPTWMTPSTVLTLILNSKHTQSSRVSSKNTGGKIRTRLRSGALEPVSWKERLNRPYKTKGYSKKPKDANQKRKEVANKHREEKVRHHDIIAERLHSTKGDNLDNSQKCDESNRSFSNCMEPPGLDGDRTELSESPVIRAQENHPAKPKLKISLPKVQLMPIPLSVAQKIAPSRFELHEGDSNDTSHRHELANEWPSESSHSAAASGLTTDHPDIKKESTPEGSLHCPLIDNSNRIDHQQQVVDVKLEENPEIKIELGGDTRSQENKERDDLRDDATLESTEIPRDFSLMRSKDRIKILRERMKMREKEIEVLTRNRPKIEEIL